MTNTNGAHDFYGDILDVLREGEIDIPIGGAFAHEHFTGIARDTKDLDLFLREQDLARALAAQGFLELFLRLAHLVRQRIGIQRGRGSGHRCGPVKESFGFNSLMEI